MLFIGGREKRKLSRKKELFWWWGENAARRKSCIALLEAEIHLSSPLSTSS
jgi:hypothetical protein